MRFPVVWLALAIVSLLAQPELQQPTGITVAHLESPIYGAVARQSRTQGDIKLEVHIRPDGTVQEAHGISGNPLLIHDAVLNIQSWTFNRGDERVIEITYEFRLSPPEIYCQVPSRVSFDLPYHVKVVTNFAQAMPN